MKSWILLRFTSVLIVFEQGIIQDTHYESQALLDNKAWVSLFLVINLFTLIFILKSI